MIFNYHGYSKTPCIYEIVNTHNGRRYIGQTKSPIDRWVRGHSQSLKRNVHNNHYLQNDFTKCFNLLGHDNFLIFNVVEALPNSSIEKRNKREMHWMKQCKKICELYNLKDECKGGNILSEETRKKISDKKKEFYKTQVGIDLIQRLANDKKDKSYEELYGAEKAELIRKKIRDNKLIEMNKEEVKENLSKLLSGKSFEERFGSEEKAKEIKSKMKVVRNNRKYNKVKHVKDIELVSPYGEIFTDVNGVKEFAKKHNLSSNHLSELLKGKRKSHKGWTLKDKDNGNK